MTTPNHSDLTFITNEGERTLRKRFTALLDGARLFDALSGYFYVSGFYMLASDLEQTEKIRILIGIGTDKQTVQLTEGLDWTPSYAETKELAPRLVKAEMENANDTEEVETGARKFLQWLKEGKLEVKAHRDRNLHAKLYIMTYRESDRDKGRVVTGSSNFTVSGLKNNLEFNVELKSSADYEYAKQKFDELWADAVDVSKEWETALEEGTWISDIITPYELYLKCLYEHFKEDLGEPERDVFEYAPEGFKKLEYQRQAVLNAKRILEEYGGVFISDVVGLGKTYISVMLAQQLKGRHLVLAPPALVDEANPGSWPRAFSDFNFHADCRSTGKLDDLIAEGTERYHNVFIDEAHHFRTDTNATYEKLAAICRGKRVILITATPYNNRPADIFSQIKLFQPARNSTIPGVPNLAKFFGDLENKHRGLNRRKDPKRYIAVSRESARKIRKHILKYLMVRRTRREIEDHFAKDLAKQGLKFPKVEDPKALFYQLNAEENVVFDSTVAAITGMLYARYAPMLYYTGDITKQEKQGHENIRIFVRILLIKRLESSFHAFKCTIDRFVKHHRVFLKQFEDGYVYTSKSHSYKLFQLLADEDYAGVDKLIAGDMASKYPAEEFKDKLKADVEKDLAVLEKVQEWWGAVVRDPKLISFVKELRTRKVLQKDNKLIVFTESKETAEYLAGKLEKEFDGVVSFSGGASREKRREVISNFDHNARPRRNDYRILVTTEVLSEGVNLHRSKVVINYDIPWNPTRLMQRVGRVNRVDTPHDRVHTFNFFPTKESDSEIQLESAAKGKIAAFIAMLGNDARLLTEDEVIESHKLFERLLSAKTITGEAGEVDSELKYLQVIKDVRENDPDMFKKVKELPKKAKTARKTADRPGQLLTYHRKGKLKKFFIAGAGKAQELDFVDAAGILEAERKTPREDIPSKDFHEKLEKNKHKFFQATTGIEEESESPGGGNRGHAAELLRYLRAASADTRQLTEDQEERLQLVIRCLDEGTLPRRTISTVLKSVKQAGKKNRLDAQSVADALRNHIPEELLKDHRVKNTAVTEGPRDVILSEYLTGD